MSPFTVPSCYDEMRKRAANEKIIMLHRNTDHLPLLYKMSNGYGVLLENLVVVKNRV